MQSRSIYLYAKTPKSGMRLVSLGLMEMLKTRVQDVAYFKPIIESTPEADGDIAFFKAYFPLKQPVNEAYGITKAQLLEWIAKDALHSAYEQILERFLALQQRYDFILCAGGGDRDLDDLVEGDLSLAIAQNLQSPVMALINARGCGSTDALRAETAQVEAELRRRHITPLALVVNRIEKSSIEEAKAKLQGEIPCFFLPEVPELDRPTMEEIATAIGAKILTKDEKLLDRGVRQSKVAAMMPEHYLGYLEEGDLVIVPGDRNDIAMATFLANLSAHFPSLAGILFTGGMQPQANIVDLIEGAGLPMLPMLLIDTDTQSAALKVSQVDATITLKSRRKISLAIGLFNQHIDIATIQKRLALSAPKEMTPVRFIYSLYEKARHDVRHILLPESEDERILRAAEIVLRRGICKVTILGKPDEVAQRASALGLDLHTAKIVDPETFPDKERFAQKFYELRKHKGVILPMAREYMSRVNYFATMMLYEGLVDGIVSGATHTTRETIKPAFEIIKTREGVKLVSSVFFMLLKDRVLVYGDCAVNPDPNAKELAQIAVSSAHTAQRFGIEPRVAMLSYSSGTSGVGADVEKVREATKIARELAPEFLIEGPMQYDAAIDPEVAALKMPGSKVAGRATVFIFPDLNTGNNTYKAVQRSSGAVAIGPILQGLKKPVNDLSRGCEIEDVIYTIAITAIQAQEQTS